ncbi:MAG TPA: hypothetical protein VFN35_11275 [Ktedonobacteraceae bacterium]|nr:hypothetical protein [Ktedonobacteraceae bacterium]
MNTTEINAILEEHDAYILALSSRMLATHQEISQIEELVQQVRIKFWQALEKQSIVYYKAYIRQIIFHEIANLWRQRRPESPLALDTEGEPFHAYNPLKPCESLLDPADIVSQRETAQELLYWTANHMARLPHIQRHAMICELKEKVDDLSELMRVFQRNHLAADTACWPEFKKAKHNLKASVSPARKTLKRLWTQKHD